MRPAFREWSEIPIGDRREPEVTARIAERFGALDNWLANAGVLPAEWQRHQLPSVTEQTVRDVLNEAVVVVVSEADLPDTGTKDAINLVVNTALHWLFTDPTVGLQGVIAANYADASYSDVIGWITE